MINATSRIMGRAQNLWARAPFSSEHRRILSATLLIGSLTMGIKLVSLLRDTVVASRLGAGDANDAYITAWLMPGFLSALVAAALVAAFLPVFVEARANHGPDAARRAYAEVMLISVVTLAVLMVGLYFSGPWLLRHFVPNYGPEKLALTNELMRIMLPALAINGLATIWAGMLNVENRFGFAAAAPVAIPLATALAFSLIPNAGVHVLATAWVFGSIVQCAVLYQELHKRGIGAPLAWYGGTPETRLIGRQFWPLVANGAVFGGLGVVDQAMAATLGPGNASVLSYGTRLVMPFLAISSMALGTSLFPHFSRLVAANDWDGLNHTLKTYARIIVATTVPLAIVIVISSEHVVRLLFERGQFTAHDTRQVALVQSVYAIIIPIECLAVMMSRVVVSLRSNTAMFYGSIGIFTFNIGADYVFKQHFGVQGIVVATVMNQTISLIFLYTLWRRMWNRRVAT